MKITKRRAYRDLYEIGLFIPDDSNKSGYKHDRSKPFPDGDKLIVPKGQYYYTWSLYGEKKPRVSLTYPDKSQLTNSYYKLALYDIERKVRELLPTEEFFDRIKEFEQALNQLILKTAEKRSNLPIQFKSNKAGNILESRLNKLLTFQSKVKDIVAKYNLKGDSVKEFVINKLNDLISEDPLFKDV